MIWSPAICLDAISPAVDVNQSWGPMGTLLMTDVSLVIVQVNWDLEPMWDRHIIWPLEMV